MLESTPTSANWAVSGPQQEPHAWPKLAPAGADFLTLRQQGYLLVDKTALLPLLVCKRNVFLARPSGFGKSMLLTQLKELFTHGTESFTGLAVQGSWHEPLNPHVILVDLHRLYDPATLEQELIERLCSALSAAGFPEARALPHKCAQLNQAYSELSALIQGAHLVVLIDDWDFPLWANLHDEAAFAANAQHLKGLFAWLRGLEKVDFIMITGIGRFKLSSNSDFLQDISMDPVFAPLLGYTRGELQSYFAAYLAHAAALSHSSEAELLRQLEQWYGGFCFDRKAAVQLFPPRAINAFLAQLNDQRSTPPKFGCLWPERINTTLGLQAYLKGHQLSWEQFLDLKAQGVTLTQVQLTAPLAFESINLVRLMVQTGFLTIKDVVDPKEQSRFKRRFLCNFTNAAAEELFACMMSESDRLG